MNRTVIVYLLLAILGLAGCSTVTTETVLSEVASFDGNEQNSGILSSSPAGYVVTDHFRDRYNALIAVYGKDFTVPIKRNAGLTRMGGGRWLLDRQHLTQFLEMNSWHRAGIKPKNNQ